MNKIMILAFGFSLLFAVQPVRRDDRVKSSDRDNRAEAEEVVKESKDSRDAKGGKNIVHIKNDKNDDRKDRFLDADSNSINDLREDDLLKIKNLNSKFRDLIKKTDKETKSGPTKKTR